MMLRWSLGQPEAAAAIEAAVDDALDAGYRTKDLMPASQRRRRRRDAASGPGRWPRHRGPDRDLTAGARRARVTGQTPIDDPSRTPRHGPTPP